MRDASANLLGELPAMATIDNKVATLHEPLLNGELRDGDSSDPSLVVTGFTSAGVLSLATFSWLNPLLNLGYADPLNIEDVPLLPKQDRSKAVHQTFGERFATATSISSALVRAFWVSMAWTGALKTLSVMAAFVGPYLIGDFVEFLSGERRFRNEGPVLVGCFFLGNVVNSLAERYYCLGIHRLSVRVRVCLTATLYEKSLRLSTVAMKHRTSGEIINYMTVDVERLIDSLWWIHDFWILPLQVLVALYILYLNVGLDAALAALVTTVATVLANIPLTALQGTFQEQLMEAKDARMKTTSECLRNMKILKLQAWETEFLSRIENLRAQEYKFLARDLCMVATSTFLLWTSPTLVAVSTFGTCVVLGVPLTPGRVLSTIAVLRVLREPLRDLADFASVYAQARVSLHRLFLFSQEPELPPDAVTKGCEDENAVEVERGTFSWEAGEGGGEEEEGKALLPTIQDVNLRIRKGAHVAVCGPVGSGKSALLACMLGEIPKMEGTVRVEGRTAYVAQTAWVQSGTFRENICFGRRMDEALYEKVLHACDLKDIALFPFGDATLIGERGINLSGGQKQRVQLARALFQEADVYLLDDPFSAVDAHTASHLLKECMMEMLASKTVVYVTHKMESLPDADHILVLRDGVIAQAGKFQDLLQSGTDFSTLMVAHNEALENLQKNHANEKEADLNANSDTRNEAKQEKEQEEDEESEPEKEKKASPSQPLVKETENVNDNADAASHVQKNHASTKKKKASDLTGNSNKIRNEAKHENEEEEEEEEPSQPLVKIEMENVNGNAGAAFQSVQQLVKEEERERGQVSAKVYWAYATDVAGGAFIPVYLVAQMGFQALQILNSYWMAWGTSSSSPEEGGAARVSTQTLILVYVLLAVAGAVCILVRAVTVSMVGLQTAQNYFLRMLRSVFRAPMSFFDATPSGRILSRMSADQNQMDMEIQFATSRVVNSFLHLLASFTLMATVVWQVLLLLVPLAMGCILLQRYYIASGRELARLSSLRKSPILNHYGESISGAATIRGFHQEERFMDTNLEGLDVFGKAFFHYRAAREWFVIRMEFLSAMAFTIFLVFLIAFPQGSTNPSLAGVAITYSLTLSKALGRFLWNLSALEVTVVCAERVLQYSALPSEAPLVVDAARPARNWPSKGTIDIHNLQVRYNAHSPLVLHGLTCTFHGGERVGVVGRTGSGKSTLILALFRVVEPAGGRIVIDGLDISTIGLHDLRSSLSIIPQDPTLFEGSMRLNLDPLGKYSDSEIWEALDKCQLGDIIRAKDEKLEASVSENGENWSVGQRQLVCLGRALLKPTRILVLDEATASVDSATDGLIQHTLRSEFRSCTVVTVAHRIPTIVDSDKVLVLDKGRVVEHDSPAVLLQDASSFFSKVFMEYSV